MRVFPRLLLFVTIGKTLTMLGQPLHLPTPNQAIFSPGKESDYFTPTVGRSWPSGTFGCVRSEGFQMHEGLDIRCTQRDDRGEPTDPVSAAADGKIVYINSKTGLSNYGKYIVMEHEIDQLAVYTLYAHLRKIANGLKVGQAKKTGEIIGILGRTSNTSQGISRERAHLHFEVCLLANPNYLEWKRKAQPGRRNDHGLWNGQNLLGINPWNLFLKQRESQTLRMPFSLRDFIQSQPVLCRVLVPSNDLQWAERYPELTDLSSSAEPIAAYELLLDANGIPVRCIPRDANAIDNTDSMKLISVDASIYKESPCRKLVFKKGQQWVITAKGKEHLNLLTFKAN